MSPAVTTRRFTPTRTRLLRLVLILAALAWLANGPFRRDTGATTPNPSGFTNFETEPVRPLALSPDGSRLFALNTADDRLEVFSVAAEGLTRVGEVGVGLRPVAVAARSNDEVWVSNHLSDSVSVVDVSDPTAPRVVRTLQVDDEPRDIVVGGPGRDRVFVATAAHRGRYDATNSIGRAFVWMFEADDPAARPQVATLRGLKARALAVSPDGRQVYAAIFKSGNRTTTVDERTVNATGTPAPISPRPGPNLPPGPGRLLPLAQPGRALTSRNLYQEPTATPTGTIQPPPVSVIVHFEGSKWLDSTGRDWTAAVPFNLPDEDVFVLDATAPLPRVLRSMTGVGTILFNMAVQPGSGEVWVTNTDARNTLRYEPNVRGRAHESRVTRLILNAQPDTPVLEPVPLNRHIDLNQPPGSPEVIAQSLSQPLDIVFSKDGQRAYVAAFGSRKVGVLDRWGNVVDRIDVGFGPAGLALDEAHGRLIVLNHLDATLSVVDLATKAAATIPLAFDPTPPEVHAGRPFLYDAALSSGYGDQSCASCHVFADMDGLAWDLGDPAGEILRMPFDLTHENFLLKPRDFRFHPQKGPMIVQSFRGLDGAGPMHWRGDRFGPEDDPGDELASFMQFRPAFKSLLGRTEPISETQMQAFGRFVLTIRYPPNPNENLDRSLTPQQKAGYDFFSGDFPADSGITNCVGCHTLPIGTDGLINFEGDRSGQDFKAPHFRNLYEKVGRFNTGGDQVSGFGFTHDGSTDMVISLLRTELFVFPAAPAEQQDVVRRQLTDYLMAFDTGMAPAVGRQLTVRGTPGQAEQTLLTTLQARAAVGDCDLVARGRQDGVERGWLLENRAFQPDRAAEPRLAPEDLLALAGEPRGELTFTCVPPGDGRRAALDRDRDGYLNGDERDAGSNPADPESTPGPTATPVTPVPPVTPGSPTPQPTPKSGWAIYIPSASK